MVSNCELFRTGKEVTGTRLASQKSSMPIAPNLIVYGLTEPLELHPLFSTDDKAQAPSVPLFGLRKFGLNADNLSRV